MAKNERFENVFSLAGCGKSRLCHPEAASFAGEGSAVRKKVKEKADSSPHQKPNGVRTDIFSLFRTLLGGRS
jgi:hypothetical protein